MIKKFDEYFKESLKDILSKEEVKDQFLRLKEVYGCYVGFCEIPAGEYAQDIDHVQSPLPLHTVDINGGYLLIITSLHLNEKEVSVEIDNIKRRLENMFSVEIDRLSPEIVTQNNFGDTDSDNLYGSDLIHDFGDFDFDSSTDFYLTIVEK